MVARSVAALTGCVAGAVLREEYLGILAAAGLKDIGIVKQSDFGALVADFVPAAMRDEPEAAGIDVHEGPA